MSENISEKAAEAFREAAAEAVKEAAEPAAEPAEEPAAAPAVPAMPEREAPEMIQKGLFLTQLCDVTKNTLPEGFPEDWTYEEALLAWAKARIPADRLDLFRSLFSAEQLKKTFESGSTACSFDWDDPEDAKNCRRLALHLMSDEDTGDVLAIASLKSYPRPEDAAEVGIDSPFRAVIRSYQLFFCVDLKNPRIFTASILRDEDGLTPTLTLPCPYAAFMKSVSEKYVRAAWEDEFLALVSAEKLKELSGSGQVISTHTFSSDTGTKRIDVYPPEPNAEDQRCFLGIGSIGGADESGLMVTAQDGVAMHAALEDLQMEIQMERVETKKKHRRNSSLLALFMVLAGLIGGGVLALHVPEVADVLNKFFPVPEAEVPVETPPPVDETVVTQAVEKKYVPLGQAAAFNAEIQESGLPRSNELTDKYETLTFEIGISDVLAPEYFETNFAKEGFVLDGSEAAVVLNIGFGAGEEIDSLIPQEAFPMKVVDEKGNVLDGYQLMDAAMGGSYNVSVAADTPTDLYKRYTWAADARYLVLSAYLKNVRYDYYFALRWDDANVDYEPLQQGDKGDLVAVLKQKLVDLGYLSEKALKSNEYDKNVTAAVKALQEARGEEVTGILDTELIRALFKGETAEETTEETAEETAEAAEGETTETKEDK